MSSDATREPDARPLLVPIVATFVVSLVVAPFAPVAAAVVFFAGGYGTVVYGFVRRRKLARQASMLPQARIASEDRRLIEEVPVVEESRREER